MQNPSSKRDDFFLFTQIMQNIKTGEWDFGGILYLINLLRVEVFEEKRFF